MTAWAIVRSCTRGGAGGSPTAVVLERDTGGVAGPGDDAARTALAAEVPASHTAFVRLPDRADAGPPAVRFFTRLGELRGCGHGTIAAHAYLVHRSLAAPGRSRLAIGGRTVEVTGARVGGEVEAWCEHGVVPVRPAPPAARAGVLAALGLPPDRVAPPGPAVVAAPGAPRLLVDVGDRSTLAALRPDHASLAAACRRLGLLGCLAYAVERAGPDDIGGAARMFAPAIGVDEDVANANSTAGLAAALAPAAWASTMPSPATPATCRLTLDQGDALGSPSTVRAEATRAAGGTRVATGGRVHVPDVP